MLPTDIRNLILEYHDEYGMIEKKRRLNNIIRHSYRNWLLDAGCFSRFFTCDEYAAKNDIFHFIGAKILITNHSRWKFFLQYFRHYEEYLLLDNLPCLPTQYSQT